MPCAFQVVLCCLALLLLDVEAQTAPQNIIPPTSAPTTIPTVDPTPSPTFQVVPTATPTASPTRRAWNAQEAKERQALKDLYTAAGGTNWIVPDAVGGHKDWTNTQAPHCDWFGITCTRRYNSAGGYTEAIVTTIDLASCGLVGSVPESIGDLAELQNLRLFSNKLEGTIPPTLASLSQLKILWLHENRLSGTIPAGLATLNSLHQLRLDSNELTGDLPSGLGDPALQPHMEMLITYKNRLGASQVTPPGCGHQFRCGV